MSIVYLILFVILICFIFSAITGIFMFVKDVLKYSSYKSELDNLIERYNKKIESIVDTSDKETDTTAEKETDTTAEKETDTTIDNTSN